LWRSDHGIDDVATMTERVMGRFKVRDGLSVAGWTAAALCVAALLGSFF
jgi:hypothetical protein